MRGASTITQQLAKNLYLSESRNPVRKLRELLITRRLEAALSKRRILEIYLNSIEWGDGIFGCEAAARAYFGKGAADLGASEAALLAGAIINPRVHSPGRPTRRLLRRQQIILRRMGGAEPPPNVPVAATGTPDRRRAGPRRRAAAARAEPPRHRDPPPTGERLVSERGARRRSACASSRW